MSNPVPMFGTQNLKDDDAQVIDDYLIETDSPPDMKAAEQPIPPTPDTGMTRLTKILTTELVWRTGWSEPQLLLASDENRLQFHMRVISPSSSTTDGIRWASKKDEARTGGRLLAGQTSGAVDSHTGAIWVWGETVAGATNSADLNIEIWAVTK